jgi:hypothetical protein
MKARNELTTLILGKTAPRAADAILAAGYRKPRTLTKHEQLLDLTKGTVLRDLDGDILVADPGPEDMWFRQIDETWPLTPRAVVLPVTVIHEPEATK